MWVDFGNWSLFEIDRSSIGCMNVWLACFLTIVIECLLSYLCYHIRGSGIVEVACLNVITNLCLNGFGMPFLICNVSSIYVVCFVVLVYELCIAMAEGFYYQKCMYDVVRCPYRMSFVLNGCSLGLGVAIWLLQLEA